MIPFDRKPACVLLVAALLAMLPLAGRAADPFVIYAIEPLTGYGAFLGKQHQIALSVMEDVVNKSGGIRGRPIKFVIEDDQSSPQISVQLFNEVLTHHPALVIAGAISATCNPLMPLVTDGPVLFCLSPGTFPPVGSYVYAADVTTQNFMAGAAVFARAKGWNKIAVITTTDASGQDADRSLEAAFTAQDGFQIVAHEHYNVTDASANAQIARVQASGAQALILWTTGTPVATALRAIQSIGLQTPLILGAANVTYAQMKAYGELLPANAYFPSTAAMGADQLPNGPLKRKVDEYRSTFKAVGLRPDAGLSTPWDAITLVVDAYRKLGLQASAAQIRDYYNNLRGWVGIHGTYDFHAIPQRGVGGEDVIMVRWDAPSDTWVAASGLGGKPLRDR